MINICFNFLAYSESCEARLNGLNFGVGKTIKVEKWLGNGFLSPNLKLIHVIKMFCAHNRIHVTINSYFSSVFNLTRFCLFRQSSKEETY